MTAYKKGKAIGQVTEILMNGRFFTEEQIRTALSKVPVEKKKRGK